MSKHNFTRLSEKLTIRFDLDAIRLLRWHDDAIDIYFGNAPLTVSGPEAATLNTMIELPHDNVTKLSEKTAMNLMKIQAIQWTRDPISAVVTFSDDWSYTLTDAEAKELKKLIGHNFDGDHETNLGEILHHHKDTQ